MLRSIYSVCGLFICIYTLLVIEVYCTTHWVVTEDGKIQAQMDSLFQLRRPYDFLALAQQEQRAVQVEELKQQLLKHKAHIDTHEDKDTQLEERIYRTDPDCLLAGKPLTEFDLSASTSVPLSDHPELRIEERLPPLPSEDVEFEEPDCVAAFTLPPFSMAALDHLQSIQERGNLSGSPELRLTMLGVKESNVDIADLEDSDDDTDNSRYHQHSSSSASDEFDLSMFDSSGSHSSDDDEGVLDDESLLDGDSDDTLDWSNRVSRALQTREGGRDWLVHSLAVQYWRVKGQPQEAIECARRALYLVPRPYRHVPLVQLSNILHRAKQQHDAAVALHMALDHHSTLYSAHLTLGHVYATMALYNVSVVCYSNAGVVRPYSALPRRLRHAVLCHARLEDALQQQHMSLQRTLSELKQYQQSHEEWLSLHQKLMLEQATPEMKLESRLEYEEQKIRESSDGRGQDCFQYQQDGHTFLSCNMRRDQLEQRQQGADLLLDLTSLLHNVQGEALRLSHLRHLPTQASLQPVLELQPRHAGDGWVVGGVPPSVSGNGGGPAGGVIAPSAAQCGAAVPLPQWDRFPTVLLSPAAKRVNIKKLVSDAIGQPLRDALPIPHHPPLCPRLPSDTAPLPPVLERLRRAGTTIARCEAARSLLAKLGAGADEHETGHRLAVALNRKVGPKWVLHNLAALYWRSQGNLWNGIECLRGVLEQEAAMLGQATGAASRPHLPSAFSNEDSDSSSSTTDATDNGYNSLDDEEEDEEGGGGDEYDDASRKSDALFVDVALTNLASLLYAVGNIDDALRLSQRAVDIADYEAESQFLLGNLLSGKGNLTGAYHRYERVLSLNPSHPHAKTFLVALACHTHHAERPAHTTSSPPSPADEPLDPTTNSKAYEGSVNNGEETLDLLEVDEDSGLPGSCDDIDGYCTTGAGDTGDGEESVFLDVDEDDEDGDALAVEEEGTPSFWHTEDSHSSFSIAETQDGAASDIISTPPSSSFWSGKSSSSVLLPTVEPPPMGESHDRLSLRSSMSIPEGVPSPEEEGTQHAPFEIMDDPLPDILLKGKDKPSLGIPQDPQFCEGYKRNVALRHFTSTWLSVSAKYIDLSVYLPPAPPSSPTPPPLPVCPSVPASLLTMDHLAGVRHRHHLPHLPEMGLLEALHSLVDPPQTMDQLAVRLHLALQQHPPSSLGGWVVCTGAALYWRVEGSGERAMDCLRAALHHAPQDMRDVPLTSLANVLHRSGLYNNALVAANAALEISPKFVVIHFTMANIYSAMDEFEKAAGFYQSTLALQSSFEPARDRLKAIQCDKWWEDQH